MRFSPDGRVFVAQKSGRILIFDSLADTTPTVFADLRATSTTTGTAACSGMALDPTSRPTRTSTCSTPTTRRSAATRPALERQLPDAARARPTDGCVVSGRLSRLTANGNVMTGTEQVLIDDWCQQFPSHSVGDLRFGPDGALYVTGGDGASFNYVDYGQVGTPATRRPVLRDPPTARAARCASQDLRTTRRPDRRSTARPARRPGHGRRLPDNPSRRAPTPTRAGSSPTACATRSGSRSGPAPTSSGSATSAGTRGRRSTGSPTRRGASTNFGWPCYEGDRPARRGYDSANLEPVRDALHGRHRAVDRPVLHVQPRRQGRRRRGCPTGGSSIAGARVLRRHAAARTRRRTTARCSSPTTPATASGRCAKGADGAARPASIADVRGRRRPDPVDLEIGPGGDLYYADLDGGTIRRIRYSVANQRPDRARDRRHPTAGAVPLTVAFDGTGSTDPDPGDHAQLRLGPRRRRRVRRLDHRHADLHLHADGHATRRAASDRRARRDAPRTRSRSASATRMPTATIDCRRRARRGRSARRSPSRASATDPQQGTLPASALSWNLIVLHCTAPTDCHSHDAGARRGSPGQLRRPGPRVSVLPRAAADRDGCRRADGDPERASSTRARCSSHFATSPGGLQLTFNGETPTAAFTRTVIEGSTNSLSAPTPQQRKGGTWAFQSWSDGGAQSHTIVAPASATTYTASYKKGR